jgi:hypothetical protein
VRIDVPEGIIAYETREYGGNVDDHHESGHLGELFAVVGLRRESRVIGGLSAWGLANVGGRDSPDVFTFIVGDCRYRCRSSVAQFLSPRVSKFQSIDATISELKLEVEDGGELFGSVLEATRGCGIAVDSAHGRTFEWICADLWDSELYESVCGQLRGQGTMDNIVDRLRFLSETRCDIFTELGFIASHLCDFLFRPDALKGLSFSMIYEVLGHGSLRLESEDSLCDFINRGVETNEEVFGLLEFIRLEYCSANVIANFLDLLSDHF